MRLGSGRAPGGAQRGVRKSEEKGRGTYFLPPLLLLARARLQEGEEGGAGAAEGLQGGGEGGGGGGVGGHGCGVGLGLVGD